PGLANARAAAVAGKPLPEGALLLEDTGFFSGQRLQDALDAGVYVLTRVPAWTAFFDERGRRLDLARELGQARGDWVDRPVRILHGSQLAVRLLAERLPEVEAQQRRARVRRGAGGGGPPGRPREAEVGAGNVPG